MYNFARICLSFLLCNFLFPQINFAQCPVAGYTASGPVCAGQSISFTNTSTGATTYAWDFCGGDFSTVPVTTDNPSNTTSPVAVTPVFDGTNWFAFMVSDDGSVVRHDYGNSLINVPTSNNLGNIGGAIVPFLRSNMSILQHGGNWYGLLANWGSSSVIRYDFGSSLTNTPTATSTVISQFTTAYFQNLVIDNGNIYLFVTTFSGTVVVLDYGTDPTGTPAVSTISATGVLSGTDIKLLKYCNNWYGFMSDYGGSSVKRLDFGTSLSNTSPTVTSLFSGSPLSSCVSLAIAFDGKEWSIIVQNYGANMVQLLLGSSLLNATPAASGLSFPAFTSLGMHLEVVKVQSAYFIFSNSYDSNKFGIINFESPCSAVPQISNLAAPTVNYAIGGTYPVSLSAYDASGNIDIFADSVTVSLAPLPGFSAQGVCFGDTTQFNDSTTVTSGTIAAWHWDFGDSDTSNLQNPSHSYVTVNTFTVILTVTGSNGCASADTQTVDITPRPFASFALPAGCSDAFLAFTDQSNISSGMISQWLWQFGNGDTSSLQNPFYSYPDGGNFDITLEVTSLAGCSDDTTFNLQISPSPDAAFIPDNTCIGQAVTFIDQTSSQLPVTTYSWDFGDAGTANVQNPTHTYPASSPTTYNVTFIVQASNSCSDTVIVPVRISNIPVANFSFIPSNVCEGNGVTFTDLSQVTSDTISKWSWDFGDGGTDTVMNPFHIFTAFDTVTVSLTAYSPSSCPSIPYTQDIIVIQGPIVNYNFSEVCLGNPTPFSDLSVAPNGSTIIDRLWLFDGADSSHLINPSHLFSTAGLHEVILTVTTNFGCTSSDTFQVAVHDNPQASYTIQNACTDYPTLFTSTSTTDSNSFIQYYQWDFGDPASGINNFSVLQSPGHIYDSSAIGFHNVTLIVENNFGCRDTVIQTIEVYLSVIPLFTYSPTCLGDLMIFTNFSENANLASTWTWNFGDNQTNAQESPAHFYVYAGTYTVTLTALSVDGCVSTASRDVTVSAIPVANFISLPACDSNLYQFQDASTVANGSIARWDWDVAGEVTFDSVQNPVYVFDSTGTYSVLLTVFSDIGCTDSIRNNITVHPLPVPNFSFSPQYGNPPLPVSFTNLTDSINQRTYTWDFGDGSGSSNLTGPVHQYNDTGRFIIQLIAGSAFGCRDSATKNIYVIDPVLDAAVTNVSASLINNQLTINASLANLGTVDIDSVIMQARLQDGTTIQEMYRQILPNGSLGIQSYQFVARFNIPPSSRIGYYCVSVIKPNNTTDDVASNNEKCSSLINELSIIEPYPNPFIDQLNVNVVLPFDDYLTVELYNMLGEKLNTLYDAPAVAGLNLVSADLFYLSDGLYVLRFSFRDQEIIRQVVKGDIKR